MFTSVEDFLQEFTKYPYQYQLNLLRKWDDDFENGKQSSEVKQHIKQKILWALDYLQNIEK